MAKQPFQVSVEPIQRSELDTRRLARLIVELATRQTELQRLLTAIDEPSPGETSEPPSSADDEVSTEEAA